MSVRGQAARLDMRVVLPGLAVLLIVSIVVSAAFGPAPIAMPTAVRIVAAHVASAPPMRLRRRRATTASCG